MCGIVGSTVSDFFSKKDVLNGLMSIKYRGPDESIFFQSKNKKICFGMNRLIIRGRKNIYPFKYKNLRLIFNGEIYNLSNLNKKINFKLTTSSDGEIILPLFDKYREEAFEKINGMFSIAIFDEIEQKIYLARDKFGEKPLYFYFDKKNFYFASEINAFPKKILSIDKNKIKDFLIFGYSFNQKTLFKNVYRLLPGEFLIFDVKNKKIFKKIYYKHALSVENDQINEKELIKKLSLEIKTIIKHKVVSDFPIGVFLSGGIDSGLISAITKKQLKKKLHTFSIGFKEKNCDETPNSNLIAKYLKTNHHKYQFTSKNLIQIWKKVLLNMDEPVGDPAIFPTYFLANKAKKYVKVVLSGEGSDELFGGYNRYYYSNNSKKRLAEFLNFYTNRLIPFESRKKILKLITKLPINQKIPKYFADHYSSNSLLSMLLSSKKNKNAYYQNIIKSWKYLNNLSNFSKFNSSLQKQLYDLTTYLPENLCFKADRATMLNSIESRAVFLDDQLIKFMNISSLKNHKYNEPKYLLKKICNGLLPNKIVKQKKHGFSLPLREWITKDMSVFVDSLIFNPHKYLVEFIPQKSIKKIVDNYMVQKQDQLEFTVWNLLITDQWLKIHHPLTQKNLPYK